MSLSADVPETNAAQSRRYGWRVFLYVLTAFIAVSAVNGYFVYMAVTTHTGEVEDNAYERGLAYNEVIEADREQKALNWDVHAKISSTGNAVMIDVTDVTTGEVVDIEKITAHLTRPVSVGDMSVDLVFVKGPGGAYFQAPLDLPAEGQWQLEADLQRGTDTYHLSKRFVIK